MSSRGWAVLAFSTAIFGTYACVGDEPTQPGSSDDSGTGNDASTSDASLDATGVDSSTSDSGRGTDAGIDSGPVQVTRVFRTSMKYFGAFGGLDQADTDCQSLATANGLGTGWKAWLSASTVNAKDRIVLGSAPITLVDGVTEVVAHGTDLLGDGGLEHTINQDETKTTGVVGASAWTGTTIHGVLAPAPNNTCHDWLIEDGGGGAGATTTDPQGWTYSALQACSTSFSLYCFGP